MPYIVLCDGKEAVFRPASPFQGHQSVICTLEEAKDLRANMTELCPAYKYTIHKIGGEI